MSRGHVTVNSDITHGVSPVLRLLRLPVIPTQLPGEMAEDGIALRQDPPVQLDDGDGGRRVHPGDAGRLVFGVFFEAVARVVVGDAGVFPQETDDLTAASGLEVEVVDRWHASDGFVAGRFGATTLGGRHFDSLQLWMLERYGIVDCTVIGVEQEKEYELLIQLQIGCTGKVGLKVLLEWYCSFCLTIRFPSLVWPGYTAQEDIIT